jgi:hypothetical protein
VHKGKEYVNQKPGLVHLYGEKLGRATFIIDARKSKDVRRLFDERGILYTTVKTWSTEQEARMVDIKDIKKKRFEFLRALFDDTDQDTWNMRYTVMDIGGKLGFDPDEAQKTAQYLHDEGLIEIMTKDRNMRITHAGIREVEHALSEPDKPTEHFPALNIIHVGKMDHSQITQASAGVTQLNILTADDRPAIENDLALLKESINQLKLPPEEDSDLRAEMETIEAQMKSSKPKRKVVEAAYASIKGILQSAAGGAAAHIAIQLLSKLHF